MTHPERYSPGTCLAIITGLAVLFWIPAVYFLAFVVKHGSAQ